VAVGRHHYILLVIKRVTTKKMKIQTSLCFRTSIHQLIKVGQHQHSHFRLLKIKKRIK